VIRIASWTDPDVAWIAELHALRPLCAECGHLNPGKRPEERLRGLLTEVGDGSVALSAHGLRCAEVSGAKTLM
jgi:hypothetical protein